MLCVAAVKAADTVKPSVLLLSDIVAFYFLYALLCLSMGGSVAHTTVLIVLTVVVLISIRWFKCNISSVSWCLMVH